MGTVLWLLGVGRHNYGVLCAQWRERGEVAKERRDKMHRCAGRQLVRKAHTSQPRISSHSLQYSAVQYTGGLVYRHCTVAATVLEAF